ncbi:hypothetical protein MUY27_17200 [Mucilaginibacter sp. RS28]|uniref:Uncharacterized protein n=1 Tax=Mucilaginibacter straminoryzae TaxID=2932774 RepID=A0A9X1XB13_9SPHI|nr:DUF6702 family protein [Mucilaginibacter straminoryzae]MCJ8211459.1 hypothetical protein [Mucilaginibacter straminoryzae]
MPGISIVSRRHPLHVATVELNYNNTDQKLEATCTLFADDFEQALEKQFHRKADLNKKELHQQMDEMVSAYIQSNLNVNLNNKKVILHYLGFENEREAINVYLESDKLPMPSVIESNTSLLYNLYDDQMVIVHITAKGVRKSSRVNYPDRIIKQSF